MTNLEYLEKAKNAGSLYIEGEDWGYRHAKALEIIAETLIDIRNFEMGSIAIYKDLVIDVHKLEKRIIKMEGKFNDGR